MCCFTVAPGSVTVPRAIWITLWILTGLLAVGLVLLGWGYHRLWRQKLIDDAINTTGHPSEYVLMNGSPLMSKKHLV